MTNHSLPSPSTPKKSWDTPRLVAFGTIEEMTQGPLSGNLDLLVGADGGFQPTLS